MLDINLKNFFVILFFFISSIHLSHADQAIPICAGSSIKSSVQGQYDASAIGFKTLTFNENSIEFPRKDMATTPAWTCYYIDQTTSKSYLFLVLNFKVREHHEWKFVLKSETPPTQLDHGALYFYQEKSKMRVRWFSENRDMIDREVDQECENEVQEQILGTTMSEISDQLKIKEIAEKCRLTYTEKDIYESYPILEQDHALVIYDEAVNLQLNNFGVKLKNPMTLVKNI